MSSTKWSTSIAFLFVGLLVSVYWMASVQCERGKGLEAKQHAIETVPSNIRLHHSLLKPHVEDISTPGENDVDKMKTLASAANQFDSPIRHCTEEEAAAQSKLVKAANVKGCSPKGDNLMRIVQLHHPKARYFIDIGSNKGYMGAHFFQLWEPKLGITPGLLKQAVGHSCGICGDCNEITAPVITDYPIPLRKAPIRVYSFDGSTMYADYLRDGINCLQNNHSIPGIISQWTSENAALASNYTPGVTVKFISHREIGHIAGENEDTSGKIVVIVPVYTIDYIVEREKLDFVDVIKIDTEGYDSFVIRGGEKTLKQRKTILLLFEYHFVWPPPTSLKETTRELESWGYICYLEGTKGLLKLTHNCWSQALEIRSWSNVWCVSSSTRQGLAIASAFDNLALVWM